MWPLRIALARLRPVGASLALRLVVVGSLFLLFIWGDYEVFRRVFGAAAKIEAVTPFFAIGLIENFLGLVFLVALMTLFFSSMTTAIGALFTDADLEIYHAAPVSRFRIVVQRWLAILIQSSYLVVFFLLPLFAALAVQYEQSWTFLAVSAIDLLALISIPVSTASILVLLLVRFFPVRRVHQVAATLGIVIITVAIVGIRMARPERLFADLATDDLVMVLQTIRLPGSELWPSHWLGAVTAARILEDGPALPSLPLAALATTLLVAFLFLASRSYFTAWVRSRESSSPVMLGAGRLTAVLDRITLRLDPATRALLGKEVRTVVRDAAQWSQIFMMVALLFIYLYNIRMMPLEGDARAALLAWLNLGMSGFVIAAICLRFAYPSMSAEGKQFWILRTAPITMRRLLWIKTAVYLLPLLVIALVLTATANVILDASPMIWIYTIASSAVITSTLAGLGVGLGALTPDFRSNNPVQVALSLGGFAYMSLSLLYVGLMMFLFTRPVQRFAVKMIFGIDLEPTFWTTTGPVILGILISALLFAAPMELARARLQRLQG